MERVHFQVIIAILNECKNLRSSVSRVAIVTIGTVAQNMHSKIDSEVEKICVVLLNKSGDVSNAFIREDANDSLTKLVKAATAGKALQGIIVAGSKWALFIISVFIQHVQIEKQHNPYLVCHICA